MTFQLPNNTEFYTPDDAANAWAIQMGNWTVVSCCSFLFFVVTGLGIGVMYNLLRLFGVL